MTTHGEPLDTRRLEPSLVALFDDAVSDQRELQRSVGDPSAIRRALQESLDVVAAALSDDVARQAVEMARQAVTTLDTVRLVRERPKSAAPSRSSLAGFLDFVGREDPAPVPTRAWLEVSVERIVDNVRDTLAAADRLRRAATPPPPEVVIRPWAEDPKIVRLLHDLLGAARRPDDFVRVRISEQLVDDLHLEHGIDVVDFDGTNARWFARVPSAVEEPRTVVPALVREGALLRAGEAHVPLDARPETPAAATPAVTTPPPAAPPAVTPPAAAPIATPAPTSEGAPR